MRHDAAACAVAGAQRPARTPSPTDEVAFACIWQRERNSADLCGVFDLNKFRIHFDFAPTGDPLLLWSDSARAHVD